MKFIIQSLLALLATANQSQNIRAESHCATPPCVPGPLNPIPVPVPIAAPVAPVAPLVPAQGFLQPSTATVTVFPVLLHTNPSLKH